MGDSIAIVADLAAIATAVVAIWAWGWYVWQHRKRRDALEHYLRGLKEGREYGRRTVLHLMANLGMTEAQVLEAAFSSKHVRAIPGSDDRGRADAIFFEYTSGDEEKDFELEGLKARKKPR